MELDALNAALTNKWQPLTPRLTVPPVNLFADVEKTELAEVIELWQDAFEWSYYDSVLKGILLASPNPSREGLSNTQPLLLQDENNTSVSSESGPLSDGQSALRGVGGLDRAASFQSIFCIDEREDSIRRHIEAVDKKSERDG